MQHRSLYTYRIVTKMEKVLLGICISLSHVLSIFDFPLNPAL